MVLGKVSLTIFAISRIKCRGCSRTRSPSTPRAKVSTCLTISAPRFALDSKIHLFGAIEIRRVAVHQLVRALARGFLGRPAIEALGALVPVRATVGEIDHDDRLRGLIEQRGGFDDPLLGPFANDALGDRIGDRAD